MQEKLWECRKKHTWTDPAQLDPAQKLSWRLVFHWQRCSRVTLPMAAEICGASLFLSVKTQLQQPHHHQRALFHAQRSRTRRTTTRFHSSKRCLSSVFPNASTFRSGVLCQVASTDFDSAAKAGEHRLSKVSPLVTFCRISPNCPSFVAVNMFGLYWF